MSRFASIVLGWIGAALGAVAVLLVGVAFWLAQGPVSIGFLTPYLQHALGESGLEVAIGDTVLAWRGFDEGLDVRLTDARLRGRGADAAQIVLPALHLRLSGRALLRGELRPAALEIDGAQLKLVREADGHFEVGLGTEAGGSSGLEDWLRTSADGDSPISELRRVVLRAARLEIEDRASGRTWRAPRTDLTITREAGAIALALSGAVEFGGRPVNLALDARWRGGLAGSQAALRFQGLDPAWGGGGGPEGGGRRAWTRRRSPSSIRCWRRSPRCACRCPAACRRASRAPRRRRWASRSAASRVRSSSASALPCRCMCKVSRRAARCRSPCAAVCRRQSAWRSSTSISSSAPRAGRAPRAPRR
jgi:hypothetical protein